MAFEMKCLRKFIRISYSEHKTNVWVQSEMNSLMGPQELLPTTVKRRKLAWFRHVTRQDSFYITILQVVLEEGDAVVGRGGNAGRTTLKSGHPCQYQSCSHGPPAKRTGRGSLLDRPSCPLGDQIGQGTETAYVFKSENGYPWTSYFCCSL